jgi:hypothetical protein
MNNTLGGLLFNGQLRPDRVTSAKPVASRGNFNPLLQSYLNINSWTTPAGIFGTAPRADGTVRGWPTYNEDMSVFKVFPIKERLTLRFDAEFGNVFNRTDFCNPNTNWSAGLFDPLNGQTGSFGQISTQCNQPRSIQFGLKLNY